MRHTIEWRNSSEDGVPNKITDLVSIRFGFQPWRPRVWRYQAPLPAVLGSSKWRWPSLIKLWVSWLILPSSLTETGKTTYWATCWDFCIFSHFVTLSSPSVLLCSFGLAPAGPLQVLTPLNPNQSIEVSLPLSTVGPVMKMEPLSNLQVTPSQYSPPLNFIFYVTVLVFVFLLFVLLLPFSMNRDSGLNFWASRPWLWCDLSTRWLSDVKCSLEAQCCVCWPFSFLCGHSSPRLKFYCPNMASYWAQGLVTSWWHSVRDAL